MQNIQAILIGAVCVLVLVVGAQQVQISGQSKKVKNIETTYAPAEFTIDYKLPDGTASTTAPIKTITSLKEIITYLNSQAYAQQKAGNANPSDTVTRPTSTEPVK